MHTDFEFEIEFFQSRQGFMLHGNDLTNITFVFIIKVMKSLSILFFIYLFIYVNNMELVQLQKLVTITKVVHQHTGKFIKSAYTQKKNLHNKNCRTINVEIYKFNIHKENTI